jgi:hypothetical protein
MGATGGPLTSDYVEIAPGYITSIPPKTGLGCSDLGITTTDRSLGVPNNVPADCNPRAKTLPGPYTGQ